MGRKLIRENKGQVAPLLLLVVAVIIAGAMLVFNVGKVSLNRVDTQNSADSGALAAASWLASGQNVIGDVSQLMYVNSLSFLSEVAAIGTDKKMILPARDENNNIIQPADGAAMILGWNTEFCANQLEQMEIAREVGENACTYADEQAKLYGFYNAGVDEYKVREPNEDYATYQARTSRFNQWLKDKGYTSGTYTWDDTKYQYWNSQTQQWVNYKPDKTNQVRIEVEAPEEFALVEGTLPGFCIYWTVSGGALVPHYVPFTVTPAFIAKMSPANPVVTVETTRQEPDPDLGLWKMNIPDITSGAKAKTVGGGPIFAQGGNYDCHLIEAW